jgi:hypothetical protein
VGGGSAEGGGAEAQEENRKFDQPGTMRVAAVRRLCRGPG